MDEQRVKCIQTFMRKSAQTEQVSVVNEMFEHDFHLGLALLKQLSKVN